MRRSTVMMALALAMLAMLSAAPSQAAPRTVRYIAPNTFGVLNSPIHVDDHTGIGGFRFPATSTAPTKVEVKDDLGTPVAMAACQDSSGDGLCDTATEPYARHCGTTMTLPSSFRANRITTVFVKVMEPVLCDDLLTTDYMATQGTITLT